MNQTHDAMLDNVAVYALGALPQAEAEAVRAHLKTCAACRDELAALTPAVTAVATASEACPDQEHGAVVASPLLKTRIMREVRRDAQTARHAPRPAAAAAPSRAPIVWPAYLVAAACFAIALISSLYNLTLMQQLKSAQTQLSQAQSRSSSLARNLTDERTLVADLVDDEAKRFELNGGEVVRVHNRIYLTMHDMPQPPRGKVYQAWTLPKGAKNVVPSVTFVPDAHGVAVISLPVDAATTGAVAVSVEPEGGSKQPTTKPIAITTLD